MSTWSLPLSRTQSWGIVVYNAAFESQRLSELAAWLPEFAGRVKKIQRRLWDLLPVIRNHVCHPHFAGSYSLKAVLPALVPEMTYEGMEVPDGQAAGLAWESLVRGKRMEPNGKQSRRVCSTIARRTRWAMIKLLEILRLHRSE